MASFKAHLFSFMMRHTFKRRLAKLKTLTDARALMGAAVKPRTHRGLEVQPWNVNGIAGERIVKVGTTPQTALLYLHGGGFFACSPLTHRAITTTFARMGFEVFVPDYRKSPEHPFPAGLNDAQAAYHAVRAAVADERRIVVAGDSAGGGLAASLLLALKKEGAPLPAGVVLFSPFVDLTLSGESMVSNASRCAMFLPEGFQRVVDAYLADADPRDPLASPLFGALDHLPPLLIHVGADETLLDDARRFAQRAQDAGSAVSLQVWPVVPHVWQLFRKAIPEAQQSMELAAAFLHTQADAACSP
jgi:acetyl esterase/lipase